MTINEGSTVFRRHITVQVAWMLWQVRFSLHGTSGFVMLFLRHAKMKVEWIGHSGWGCGDACTTSKVYILLMRDQPQTRLAGSSRRYSDELEIAH